MRLGQPGDHRPETRLGVHHAAVQHDERSACPVDLVVEVDAVDHCSRTTHRSLLLSYCLTTWNSTRYRTVSSWMGPACAARRRRLAMSGSPVRARSSSGIDENGRRSISSTSIRPEPLRQIPPTLTFGLH